MRTVELTHAMQDCFLPFCCHHGDSEMEMTETGWLCETVLNRGSSGGWCCLDRCCPALVVCSMQSLTDNIVA